MSAEAAPVPPLTLRVASKLFEIETTDPGSGSRAVMKVVCALFGMSLLWAIFAKLDITAVAEGRLVPQTYVKIVQPAESGIVREIRVKEGDRVEQGQVLVRLDPTVTAADGAALQRELALQRLQLRRIEAELAGAPLLRNATDDPLLFTQVQAQLQSHRQAFLDAVAGEQVAKRRAEHELASSRETLQKLAATLPSYEKSAKAFEKLADQKLMGALQAEEKRREAQEKTQDLEAQRGVVAALEAAIEEHTQKLAQLNSSYRSDLSALRVQTLSIANQVEQNLAKNTYREGLLELKAPQAGIVKELATTTLGAVVQPGTVLLSLVPADEPLLAEVAIANQDIGFVQVGQKVRIKLAAYPFQKYGMVEGVVRTISADTQSSDPGHGNDQVASKALSFKALVELHEQRMAVNGLSLALGAGMQVTAEIVQGKRTVLEYLLSPVQRVGNEAGRER
ncbi:MAG: HlyD family type I secretion periplasmic adaptor subunit [Steroidobacteraceae bacterium]